MNPGSSGRGGKVDEGGLLGGESDNLWALRVSVSLNEVFVAGADCGGLKIETGVAVDVEPCDEAERRSSPGVGGRADKGAGLCGGGMETR